MNQMMLLKFFQELEYRDTDVQNSLMDSVGEGEGGMIWGMTLKHVKYHVRNELPVWMFGASALGRPRGMVWGGRREEGSGWGTHVYLWRIHFDIWQN